MILQTSKHTLLALVAVVGVAACGNPQATKPGPTPSASASPSPSPVPSPSPTPDLTGPPLPAPASGPLPGQTLPMSGPLEYPLLIQLENTAPARPQTGLDAASVVFQYLTEGGITRFSALYHRVPGIIGPVRSARFISVYLYQRLGALLMASGGANATYQKIHATGVHAVINDFDGGKHFFRWGGRAAPHNVYSTQAMLLDAANLHVRPARSDDFLRSATWAGTEAATSINVPELMSTYTWDGSAYTITSDGAPETDTIYGTVKAQSVAVLHVPQFTSTEAHDINGTFVRDFDFKPGGAAEFYAKGTVIRGRWSTAPGETGMFTFTDSSGNPLGMPPGLLWVAVANP